MLPRTAFSPRRATSGRTPTWTAPLRGDCAHLVAGPAVDRDLAGWDNQGPAEIRLPPIAVVALLVPRRVRVRTEVDDSMARTRAGADRTGRWARPCAHSPSSRPAKSGARNSVRRMMKLPRVLVDDFDV
jgi:hypothetical protein